MGCCASSPHARRVYRDPADLDEEIVPLRYFGTIRSGSNLVPDDIDGLPSTHIYGHLASDADDMLYEAEMDAGAAFRCYRLSFCLLFTPCGVAYMLAKYSLFQLCAACPCEEACCYVRKEYSTRRWWRVYPNRIELNSPHIRCPYGCLGCGSWNADTIVAHPYDRGAFGFSAVKCGTLELLCCMWPVYGGSVVRHRCQCNGPLWNRMFTDCGGWWCDEWICQRWFCAFTYPNMADPDEAAFAASIALQAYYEGRAISREDMDKCIQFWKDHIAEHTDPIGRKRPVCCEPYLVPWCNCNKCYRCCHPGRKVPVPDDQASNEIKEMYDEYEAVRTKQIQRWEEFQGPVGNGTVCRSMGCRRFFGRKGCIFCTEGCSDCGRKAGEPAPPRTVHDFDDEWDASTVLMHALGPPPANVVIRRWRWDPEKEENVLDVYPPEADTDNADDEKKAT